MKNRSWLLFLCVLLGAGLAAGPGYAFDIPFFSISFEGSPNWTPDNGIWEVGSPTSGPGGCQEGNNCAATILAGNYPGTTDSRLILPMLYPWDKFNSDYAGWRKLMGSFLKAGADGYAVWDALDYGPWGVANRFSRVAGIGLDSVRAGAGTKPKARRIKLLSVQGFRVDRYHQFEVL